MENSDGLTKKEKRQMKRAEKEALIDTKQKKQKRNTIIIWALIFIFIGLGAAGITYLVSKNGFVMNGGGASQPALLVLADDDWSKGNKEAKTTLIEYSDFQCPACAYYHPTIEKLGEDFNADLKIIYRHFPLPQHKNAVLAAATAEAAGKQGKFWEMAGLIFESQNEWSEAKSNEAENIFKKLAVELNLDISKFENDLKSEEVAKSIDDDYKNGVKLGINATPSFFLNGEKINNPRTYEEFKKILEKELEK